MSYVSIVLLSIWSRDFRGAGPSHPARGVAGQPPLMVGVDVGVAVSPIVNVGVLTGVAVGVFVSTGTGLEVAVGVFVGVLVSVGDEVGRSHVSATPLSERMSPRSQVEHCELVASEHVITDTQPTIGVHGRQGPGLPPRYFPAPHEVQSLGVGPLQVAHDGSHDTAPARTGQASKARSNTIHRTTMRSLFSKLHTAEVSAKVRPTGVLAG